MTDLSPNQGLILECAAAISDDQLTIIAEGVEYVIHHDVHALAHMKPFVQEMHTASGLLERVQESTLSIAEVEQQLIAFFVAHCEPHKTLLCGNSIWVDRSFLKKYMPQFEALFFYRMIDVSTVKELAKRWYPQLPEFKKQKKHTALSDLHESIGELRYYRENLFK